MLKAQANWANAVARGSTVGESPCQYYARGEKERRERVASYLKQGGRVTYNQQRDLRSTDDVELHVVKLIQAPDAYFKKDGIYGAWSGKPCHGFTRLRENDLSDLGMPVFWERTSANACALSLCHSYKDPTPIIK